MQKNIFFVLLMCFFLILSLPSVAIIDDKKTLTPATPDESAEFAIGLCLGGLDDLDRVRIFAKHEKWQPLTKEQLLLSGVSSGLKVDGWKAINNNHIFLVAINEGEGALCNDKFVDNAKSNVCTVIDAYSDRNDIMSSLKKYLLVKQIYYDPGTTLPLEKVEAFKINNGYFGQEPYLMVISHKDLKPPIILTFMAEKSIYNQ